VVYEVPADARGVEDVQVRVQASYLSRFLPKSSPQVVVRLQG
jgi:hypothetical protein